MSDRTIAGLRSMQAAPLEVKLVMTQRRIAQWVDEWGEEGVYISFSGGKDSTVLLDIVRQDYPNIPAVFVDIPTQFPELRQFVTGFNNVVILKPKMNFFQVCEKYGFPIFGKEIAGCIYDAKRCLTKLEAKANATTDRQTDRQRKRSVCDSGLVGDRKESERPQFNADISSAKSGDYP